MISLFVFCMIMKRYAIIVAGGKGRRMGMEVPKQFILVNQLPILGHTLKAFRSFSSDLELIVVMAPDWMDYWLNCCDQFDMPAHQLVAGGQERFHSVLEGLKAVPPGSLVAIHDAVRPLVSHATIDRCFTKAEEQGAAVPVVPLKESIRKITDYGSEAVDRSRYLIVQTPQCFQFDELISAYDDGFQDYFTDDASVFEAKGKKVVMVDGNDENIKITTPDDLLLAELLLQRK